MGIFKTNETTLAEEREQRDNLLTEMAELRAEIHGLRQERGDLQTRDRLQAEIERLKKDTVAKQIEYDREKEKWDRERREVEHLVGLQRKTADFEKDQAIAEAKMTERERAITAKEDEFERQLKFNKEQMTKTQDFLERNFSAVLDRLPDVNVALEGGIAPKPQSDGEKE
jgi:hypothetical protein